MYKGPAVPFRPFIVPAAINKIRRVNFGLGNRSALGYIKGVQQPLTGVALFRVCQLLGTGQGGTRTAACCVVHCICIVLLSVFVLPSWLDLR